jgi:hypothetical protein
MCGHTAEESWLSSRMNTELLTVPGPDVAAGSENDLHVIASMDIA